LIAGSAVAYSTAGFFTRLIQLDLWTLILWRGLFSTAFLLGVAHVKHGRQALRPFRELDRWGWVAAGFSTAAMFCYLAALRNTSVADVAIIYGTAPFVTAAVARIVLGERTTSVTFWCSAVALTGVALMFGGSSVSHAIDGDLLALAMTVLMALMIIAARRSQSASSLPIAAISSLASSIVGAPLAHPAQPHLVQLAELALFGITQLGLGLLLLTAGAKRLSASRVALIGGLDVPLAPVWVWIAYDETPSPATVAGGVTVIAAVILNTLLSSSRSPTQPRRKLRLRLWRVG
jgi:drug/metabolite transporter (DMT)-like permease